MNAQEILATVAIGLLASLRAMGPAHAGEEIRSCEHRGLDLHTKVIIGVKSTRGPSWELGKGRMVTMLAAYAFFWPILFGRRTLQQVIC